MSAQGIVETDAGTETVQLDDPTQFVATSQVLRVLTVFHDAVGAPVGVAGEHHVRIVRANATTTDPP